MAATSRAKLTSQPKISVLLSPEEGLRFDAYCRERGYKKSTLIARLIREHLEQENFAVQTEMFPRRKA